MSRAISSSTMRRNPGSAFWKTVSTLPKGTSSSAGSRHSLVMRVVAHPVAAATIASPRKSSTRWESATPRLSVRAQRVGRLAFQERAAEHDVRRDQALVVIVAAERHAARERRLVAQLDARALRIAGRIGGMSVAHLEVGGAHVRARIGLRLAPIALGGGALRARCDPGAALVVDALARREVCRALHALGGRLVCGAEADPGRARDRGGGR